MKADVTCGPNSHEVCGPTPHCVCDSGFWNDNGECKPVSTEKPCGEHSFLLNGKSGCGCEVGFKLGKNNKGIEVCVKVDAKVGK